MIVVQEKEEEALLKAVSQHKGHIYGNWEVLGLAPFTSKYKQTMYRCKCLLCGNEYNRIAKFVIDESSPHHPFSCGCLSKGVYTIKETLNSLKIEYEEEVTIRDLISPKKFPLRFDFVLKVPYEGKMCKYAAIEYDGQQHTSLSSFMRVSKISNKREAEKKLAYYNICDALKEDYCRSKGLHLLRINYSRDVSVIKDELLSLLYKVGLITKREKEENL